MNRYRFPLLLMLPGQALAEASARAVGSAPVDLGQLAQVAFGLLAVLTVIVGLAWMVRRMGGLPGGSSGVLRIQAALSVGQRERVVLIQAGETQLLLGVAPGRVESLHVFAEGVKLSTPASEGEAAPIHFSERLRAAMQGRLPRRGEGG